jgi:hypothetical protein
MMASPLIPHFDLPFRFGTSGRHAASVEQDSIDDVTNCVETLIRCPIDFRPEVPGYGTPDQTLQMAPVDSEFILSQALRWEPRASVLIEQSLDSVDYLITKLLAQVAARTEEVPFSG